MALAPRTGRAWEAAPSSVISLSPAGIVCLHQVLALPHLSLLCPSRRKLSHPQAPLSHPHRIKLGVCWRGSWEGACFCTPAPQRCWRMCASCVCMQEHPWTPFCSLSTLVCLHVCLPLLQHLWGSLCLSLWLSFLCFSGLLFIFVFFAHCVVTTAAMLALSPDQELCESKGCPLSPCACA